MYVRMYVFRDRAFLCNSFDCPGTQLYKADLEIREASQVLDFKI